MQTQSTPFAGELWFFTGRWSAKTFELDKDQRVNLSYASPDKNTYVSISGTARAVVDRANEHPPRLDSSRDRIGIDGDGVREVLGHEAIGGRPRAFPADGAPGELVAFRQ